MGYKWNFKSQFKIILTGALVVATLTGCATAKQKKALQTMAVSGLVGGVLGASLAPKGDNETAHAALGAAIGAAAGGAFSLYYFDDSKEIANLQKEKVELVEKIKELAKYDKKGILAQGQYNFFARRPPKEFSDCVKPGYWEVLKEKELTDEDGEAGQSFVRKGKKFRIVPPELKPCE